MINDFKDLEKLLKLCRKQGVTDIELGSVKIKLGDLPVDQSKEKNSDLPETHQDMYAGFPDRILTNDELMFYSSGGAMGTDPNAEGGAN